MNLSALSIKTRRTGACRVRTSALAYLVIILLSVLLGLIAMLLGESSNGRITAVVILPGALLLLFAFILAGKYLNDIILISRASIDLLLNQTRVSGGLGLGAAINLVVILAASRVIFEKDRRYRQGFNIWIPFLIVISLSLIQAPDKIAALKVTISLLTCVAAFVTGRAAVLNGYFARLLHLTLGGSAIAFVISAGLFLAGKGYFTEIDGGLRFTGIFGHANILAFFCVINSAIVLYIEQEKGFKSWQVLAFSRAHLLLALLLLVETRTRSAWAAELVLFLGYACFFKRRYFLYLVLALGAAFTIPSVQDRIFGLFSPSLYHVGGVANSFEWRLLLWHDALHSLSPLQIMFGRGLASFFYYSTDFFTLAGRISWGAHSIFVQMIYEIGVIGVAAFSFVLLRCIYTFLKALSIEAQKNSASIGIFLILMYIFVGYSDNMFDYVAFNYYFYSLLGALLGRVSFEK